MTVDSALEGKYCWCDLGQHQEVTTLLVALVTLVADRCYQYLIQTKMRDGCIRCVLHLCLVLEA